MAASRHFQLIGKDQALTTRPLSYQFFHLKTRPKHSFMVSLGRCVVAWCQPTGPAQGPADTLHLPPQRGKEGPAVCKMSGELLPPYLISILNTTVYQRTLHKNTGCERKMNVFKSQEKLLWNENAFWHYNDIFKLPFKSRIILGCLGGSVVGHLPSA